MNPRRSRRNRRNRRTRKKTTLRRRLKGGGGGTILGDIVNNQRSLVNYAQSQWSALQGTPSPPSPLPWKQP